MKLTAAQMKYMLVLGELDSGCKIRCTDVARRLQVKKPSVCGMLCRLERMGLISQDPYSDICITEAGKKLLEECGKYYKTILGLLEKRLDLSEKTAGMVAAVLVGNLDPGLLEELLRQEKQ